MSHVDLLQNVCIALLSVSIVVLAVIVYSIGRQPFNDPEQDEEGILPSYERWENGEPQEITVTELKGGTWHDLGEIITYKGVQMYLHKIDRDAMRQICTYKPTTHMKQELKDDYIKQIEDML